MVPMLWLLLALLAVGVLCFPGYWVRHTLRKYSEPRDRYRCRGTGADLARHLLDHQGLANVAVEMTAEGDHYDPRDRAVRLAEPHYAGHSLTAIAVASHEVGHALQHADRNPLLTLRTQMVHWLQQVQSLARIALISAPLVLLLTRSPTTALAMALAAIAPLALGALVHLVTLPVELDASFRRALPLLVQGRHLHSGDLPHARRILTAAALTYLASALMAALSLGYWLRVLRR